MLDGAGAPVPDALVETWSSEPAAFARCPTDDDGRWFVVVPAPQAVAGQAPHLAVNVLARGLLHRLVTRIYFPGEALNASDLVLAGVPAERRGTLMARAGDDGHRFDIRLQGDDETVFFDV